MKKEEEQVEVIFRKYKVDGQVIALFPHIVELPNGSIMCYMHMGQHGTADYQQVVKDTTLAVPSEYQPLKNELISEFGYNLLIISRRDSVKYRRAHDRLVHRIINGR